MRDAEAWAARLASGAPVAERVAVVVAHPDDETLWTGSLLARLGNALLIHVTDGAPEDMEDAGRLGFGARESYVTAREAEIGAALDALGARPVRLSYGVTDKCASDALIALTERLARDIADAAVVVTHPYEGGHPDHDACAWAVAAACRRLGPAAPAHVEFACYQERDGERLFGRFAPEPAVHAYERPLGAAERLRVAEAIGAHRTQAAVIGDWTPDAERWRAAPAYDFSRPPPGPALYDRFGWDLTSEHWCELARAAERMPAPC